MNISREQILALAEVKTTNVSVELYVAGVKAREWLGCGDWNVDAAQKIADEINGKAVIRDEAAIEAYKAELLKGAGEPVAWLCWLDGDDEMRIPDAAITGYEPKAYKNRTPLFTSDQVATAVARETKPLESEIERLKRALKIANELLDLDGPRDAFDVIAELRTQLAAAQEEIAEMRADHLKLVEENHSLRDQLAKAEQRVAEACALTYLEDYDLTDIAERVRAGEYRKFMKGE